MLRAEETARIVWMVNGATADIRQRITEEPAVEMMQFEFSQRRLKAGIPLQFREALVQFKPRGLEFRRHARDQCQRPCFMNSLCGPPRRIVSHLPIGCDDALRRQK